MPGIADYFSAENVGSLMQDPRLMLGLQLLAQGRQGSSGQAIGQAGSQAVQLYGQQRHQQELANYRNQMLEAQQADQQLRQQAAQAKAQQQAEYRARLQDPAFLASLSPLARQMAQLGVDPSELIRATNSDNMQQHRQASLAQQSAQFNEREARIGANTGSSSPRMPTQRQVLDQPLGDGMMQRHVLNPQTGQYEAYGKPFPQYSPGRKSKDATGADAATEAIMGAEAEPVPDASSLPGNAPLSAYAPGQQQGPVGVLPMSAAGGNAAAKPQVRVPSTRKPAVSGDLAAAKGAVAAGKSRQAVVNRLMQAGYTAERIKEAGI
ncbi:hypothetical protein [Pseudomonas kurunegalensis]|uniref:hypothetical protein n=1 Tax=Pseudomonas kurunegalensis TaxID=485880 RepID=UPI0023637137|nr:hypothetical protein [Pseudomonas kurunegalensis]MDD2135649.1 hypothetical protein [Pseudomonas kurunegalensis]